MKTMDRIAYGKLVAAFIVPTVALMTVFALAGLTNVGWPLLAIVAGAVVLSLAMTRIR